MKKYTILSLLLCGIMLISLAGCGSAPAPAAEEPTYSGIILEADENYILVELAEENWSLWSQGVLSTSLEGAVLEAADGSTITAADLLVGGTVTVTYDGTIKETYPGQVAAHKIVFDGSTITPKDGTTGLVNPMIELDTPDYTEYTGFSLSGLPDRDDLRAEKYFAYKISDEANENIAEVNLRGTVSDSITLRVAVDQGKDISGIYEEFSKSETQKCGDISVTVQSSDNNVLATWTNNGYTFSVYLMNCSAADAAPVIEELAISTLIAVK